MEPSLSDLQQQIDDATELLLRTCEQFDDAEAQEPSLLVGWSRGHVLTHLARDGEALAHLLDGARTDMPAARYADDKDRENGIEAGAHRSAAELTADVRQSAAVFKAACAAMPADKWATPVTLSDKQRPASRVLTVRLVEVELHHTDLGADYLPSDWPTTFNQLELADPERQQRADRLV